MSRCTIFCLRQQVAVASLLVREQRKKWCKEIIFSDDEGELLGGDGVGICGGKSKGNSTCSLGRTRDGTSGSGGSSAIAGDIAGENMSSKAFVRANTLGEV